MGINVLKSHWNATLSAQRRLKRNYRRARWPNSNHLLYQRLHIGRHCVSFLGGIHLTTAPTTRRFQYLFLSNVASCRPADPILLKFGSYSDHSARAPPKTVRYVSDTRWNFAATLCFRFGSNSSERRAMSTIGSSGSAAGRPRAPPHPEKMRCHRCGNTMGVGKIEERPWGGIDLITHGCKDCGAEEIRIELRMNPISE